MDEPGMEPATPKNPLHWVKPIIFMIFVGIMGFIIWRTGGKYWFDLKSMTHALQDFGKLAPVVYILLRMVGVVILFPSIPLDGAGGVVFGPILGTVYAVIGSGAGALISFYLAHVLGREAMTRLLKRDISFCDMCTECHLFYVILAARLLPMVSFAVISYGAGLTQISTKGFLISTLLGMLPITLFANFAGRGFMSSPGSALLTGGIFVLLFFLVPVLIKRVNPWGLYERMTTRSPSHR